MLAGTGAADGSEDGSLQAAEAQLQPLQKVCTHTLQRDAVGLQAR